MTKVTLEVDDGVGERIADAAAELGVAPETVAAEVLTERFPPRPKLGFRQSRPLHQRSAGTR